jgi:hypothetical protein
MRDVLVLLAVALMVTPAAAQQWTDPEGHLTLNHGLGWQLVSPDALTDNPQVLAIFTSVDPPARRLCNIRRQVFEAPAELDQAAANRWIQLFPAPPPQAMNPSSDEMEGVLFINYELTGGELVGRYRAFALPSGAAVIRTEFMCATRAPATAEDEAGFNSFLSAIELAPRTGSRDAR